MRIRPTTASWNTPRAKVRKKSNASRVIIRQMASPAQIAEVAETPADQAYPQAAPTVLFLRPAAGRLPAAQPSGSMSQSANTCAQPDSIRTAQASSR